MAVKKASGLIFILSGPSGVGKTSLRARLQAEGFLLSFGVTATTRGPRPGEVQGRHYYFYSTAQFEKLRRSGELFEWVEQHGHLYGTPKSSVRQALRRGHDLMLEVDVNGAVNIKRLLPQAVLIFLKPPSFAALERRLRNADTGRREGLGSRLAKARAELERAREYDYVVVNREDDLRSAVEAVKAIVVAERHRTVPRSSEI